MSKNKIDRRDSSFKARDNIEIIFDKIFILIENEFASTIAPQEDNSGIWEVNDNRAKIELSFDSAFKNLDGKCIILNCEFGGRVSASTIKTWSVDVFRTKLIDATFQLMEHVNIANGIHPITIAEFNERRLNQDLAITDCYHILHILQRSIRHIRVKPSKIEIIVKLIDEELRLLKGWRKSEYKKKAAIQKRELGS